jgi:hypothetical protein
MTNSDTLEPLTEQIIQKVTLRFFRHYYKFRLRYEDQPVVSKYDLEGVGGIIADGLYSFKKADGQDFRATFEATSRATRNEVIFKTQPKVLFWDSLAISSVFCVFLFSFNLLYPLHVLDERTFVQRIALTVLFLLTGMGVYAFFARHFRRYRYIYAIEQFKKYHADEQWIALSYDVFGTHEERLLNELKNQCIFNGFGLLMIDKNLDPKILITPSRQEVFEGKRKAVELTSQTAPVLKTGDHRNTGWWQLFRSNLPAIFQKDTSILRFRKTFYHQMAVVAACLSLLGVIFSKEMQKIGFQSVEQQKHFTQTREKIKNKDRESISYLGDSASTPKLKKPSDKLFIEEKATEEASDPPRYEAAQEPAPEAPQEEFTSRGVEEFLAYDCARFYNFDTRKYIVMAGQHANFQQAKKQMDQLAEQGMEVSVLRLSCFDQKASGYAVYAGLFYNTLKEATIEREKLGEQAAAWRIKGLTPPVRK